MPRRTRRNPGPEQSARRSLGIRWSLPVAPPFRLTAPRWPPSTSTRRSSAGDAVISLSGELDLSGAPALDEEIGRLATADGVERVVLDLRELEFLDSSGLRSVALADRRARPPRGAISCSSAAARPSSACSRSRAWTSGCGSSTRPRPQAATGRRHDDRPRAAEHLRGARPRPRRAGQHRRARVAGPAARPPAARLRAGHQRRAPRGRRRGAARRRATAAASLRVEVHDPGSGFELEQAPTDPLRASGWGLVLVAELADRWGVDQSPRTRVWFEMDA